VFIKTVVFDLDGTIVDFNLDYKKLRAEVRDFFLKQNFPQSVFPPNESIFRMLEKAAIYMKNHGKDGNKISKIKRRVFSIADHYELEAAHKTDLISGVKEALKILQQLKLKIGIFTLNGEKSAKYIIESRRLKRYFDIVISREAVSKVKPDSAHLEAALKGLQAKPEEAIVVGDGVGDMKCAKELGATAVGLATGVCSPKELAHAGANYLITSPLDLPTLIKQLNTSDPKSKTR
jgi:HAD superfamily hydrolase (TIGR01549 family)